MRSAGGDPKSLGHRARSSPESEADGTELAAAIDEPPSPRELTARAQTCYLGGDFAAALDAYERAFVGLRSQPDERGALRVATWLAYLYAAVFGNFAACRGWLRRAQRLADTTGECPERGWAALMLALVTEDQDAQDRHIVAARAAAIQSADVDLEFAALGFEGWSLVARGQVSAGMALLDEAAAAATGGEVSDLATIADIYCKMLMACELALDVRRAEQWMTVVESLSRRTQCLAPPLLYCRTSYCGILVARGRWADAEAELELSLQAAASEWEALRAGAIIRLANLRLGQGRLDEADELLAGYEHEPSATRPLARLYVAQGEVERAAALLRRQLSSPQPVIERAGVLALVVETELAAGRTDRGSDAAAQLQQLSEASDAPLLAILGHWAAGLVACATSDDHAAAYLESAISGFGNADLSFEEARARLQLAKTAAATNRALAITEARTALARFEQLSAAPYADDAARFLRELGVTARSAPRSKGTLTQRERQVLGLLAEGLTNEQIATRLYVSTRTAEHHVSNILSKLGVRNRASAVAYAIRHPVEHHGRA